MNVHKLRLENIRCFENCEITFSKGITILTGANNSGKSTILRSLYRLQDLQSISHGDVRTTQEYGKIILELHDIDKISGKMFLKAQTAVPVYDIAFVVNDFTEITQQSTLISDTSFENRLTISNINTLKNDPLIKDGPFLLFAQSEDQNNFIYPYFSKRKTNQYYTQGGRDATFLVWDSLRNLPAKVQKVMSQPSNKKKFSEICMDILGFEIGIISGDSNEIRLGFYTTNNKTIPIESMGEGVANILGIIVTLLTENGKLYLIEELENDIHPMALKKILNLIIEKSHLNQFVISTHSNIVLKYLGGIESAKIYFTETGINSVKENIHLPTSSLTEIENSPQQRLRILEQLGYDLFDMDIYSGFLILEESSSKRIIREFLIPLFFPNLRFKLKTIAAQGASDVTPKFNDLHRLFLYVHTNEIYKGKAWVITDGDCAGLTATQSLKEKFKNWDESHFMNFDNTDFESYYPNRFQAEANDIADKTKNISKEDKRKRKANLLTAVIDWASANTKEAETEFKISAKEVIDKLGAIAKKLSTP